MRRNDPKERSKAIRLNDLIIDSKVLIQGIRYPVTSRSFSAPVKPPRRQARLARMQGRQTASRRHRAEDQEQTRRAGATAASLVCATASCWLPAAGDCPSLCYKTRKSKQHCPRSFGLPCPAVKRGRDSVPGDQPA